MEPRTTPWPSGTPCWVDLQVPDVAAVGAFYSGVLGWHVSEPDEQFGGYVIADVEGVPVAGLGPLSDPRPSAWTLYFGSADAEATQSHVVRLGGSVLLPAADVGTLGRMLVAADPTGSVFGVWEAGEFVGMGTSGTVGSLTWDDLRSTDPDRARAFYVELFDLRTEPVPMAGPDYVTFATADGGAPLGGIGGMFGAPEGTPSHWLVYFGVTDVAAAVAATMTGGGAVLGEPFDTPYGRMAALQDPAGAVFWVVTTTQS